MIQFYTRNLALNSKSKIIEFVVQKVRNSEG